MSGKYRELVNDLRQEWKTMWRSRIEDEERAEGVASRDFNQLFVDRGLILFATRDFKAPSFHEVLTKHLTPEEIERNNPNPIRGGIHKFIRNHITNQRNHRTEMRKELQRMKKHQFLKHGGKGWLHSKPKLK